MTRPKSLADISQLQRQGRFLIRDAYYLSLGGRRQAWEDLKSIPGTLISAISRLWHSRCHYVWVRYHNPKLHKALMEIHHEHDKACKSYLGQFKGIRRFIAEWHLNRFNRSA